MIETTQLERKFGTHQVLKSIDLRVEPGEIVGLLGPNGAGKTTTVRILTGLLRPTSGTVRVSGFNVEEDPIEVKKRVGFVPETGALYETLTARAYLDLVANVYRMDRKVADKRIESFLHLFNLLDDSNVRTQAFSKGMKQKIAICSALLPNPEVLLLDEPFDGLDATTALVVKDLLKELSLQGRTILLCSHILEVVEQLCTRLVIIHKGNIVSNGTSEEICVQARSSSLSEAFSILTGRRNTTQTTKSILNTLEEKSS